jgi:hypothetical protein
MYRRIGGTLAAATAVALVVMFVVRAHEPDDLAEGTSAGPPQQRAAAVGLTQRAAGTSYVRSDSTSDLTALRPCPAAPISSTNVCGPLDRLPDDTVVVMRCWVDGSPPDANATSTRWLYVTEVTGPHPGWSGYVYSILVHDQITVPLCTPAILDAYPLPTAPPVELSLARGPAASAGYWYAITLRSFPSNVEVSITCYDSVSPDGFKTFDVRTDDAGAATAKRNCYSGDGPDHWVQADGDAASSNHVTWGSATTPSSRGTKRPEPPLSRAAVRLARGPSAPAGYWYTVTLQGFADGAQIPVTCYDSISPGGFKTFTVRVNGTGAGFAQRGCYSGDGPDHWVRAGGLESNHVRWTQAAPPPTPPLPPPPAEPKPTVANFVVVIYGGGHIGVAYDVGWQPGRDPVTCHFFIDGREAFTAQCGTHSSKQFYGLSPGQHAFHATVSDRYGIYSDPTPTVVRQVT